MTRRWEGRPIGLAVRQEGPGNPKRLVGESYYGEQRRPTIEQPVIQVAPTAPLLRAYRMTARAPITSSRGKNRDRPACRFPPEALLPTARVLPWLQAQSSGDLPARPKAPWVGHRRVDRRCRKSDRPRDGGSLERDDFDGFIAAVDEVVLAHSSAANVSSSCPMRLQTGSTERSAAWRRGACALSDRITSFVSHCGIAPSQPSTAATRALRSVLGLSVKIPNAPVLSHA
jgi:hypothetical protein